MQRIPVESSNVRAVGYDAETETLEVEFHGGGAYAYDAVPPEVHEALMVAGSVGRYFNANVKSTYTFRKLA